MQIKYLNEVQKKEKLICVDAVNGYNVKNTCLILLDFRSCVPEKQPFLIEQLVEQAYAKAIKAFEQ